MCIDDALECARSAAYLSAEQRHVAKPTPMTPLSAVLQEACSKMRPPLDPSQCQLILNKKPVDLGLPVRLANIPSGSKLELVKRKPALLTDSASQKLGTGLASECLCLLAAAGAASAAPAAPARPVAQVRHVPPCGLQHASTHLAIRSVRHPMQHGFCRSTQLSFVN